MRKSFNITGTCFPDYHYMMDTTAQMARVMDLIEFGAYFTINRPRQFGKTTTMQTLNDQLLNSEEYLPIKISFENVGDSQFKDEVSISQNFLVKLATAAGEASEDLEQFIKKLIPTVHDLEDLSTAISTIIKQVNKKVVLMIDEVDASSHNPMFLKFLGALRDKYLNRLSKRNPTFQSVILAGVHDIKTLKIKMRSAGKGEYNSPWNIAADFKVRMSFIPSEIVPMLEAYCQEEEVVMDLPAIAERLYYHTAGYPFLVSKLCKTIAEDILPQRVDKKWTLEDVEASVRLLLKENNTNFDSLIKNLENNSELYALVKRIIIEGEKITFNPDEPVMHFGRLYGMLKNNGVEVLKIHNRIYEQRIYNYMTAKATVQLSKNQNYAGHFVLDNNELDIKAVLLKFQQTMKEQYSEKNKDFLEAHGRVLFLAFLSPILNGHGYSFKEVQVSLEKRLDVVITFLQHRYIIELKKWYGTKAHEKGLDQLADYLDIHNLQEGWLLIFDDRKKKIETAKSIKHKGKAIFAVWV